jgi:sugar-specific transcriptional regulator TrmB
MLQAAGVTEFEEAIYRALLQRPAAPLAELAASANASPARTRPALARLVELGLVRRAHNRFIPVQPEAALAALVNRRKAELDAVQGAATELAEEFRAGELQAHPAGLVEVITGVEAINSRATELFEAATQEVMAFDAPPYALQLSTEVSIEEPILARGVRIRVIYSQSALEVPGRYERIKELTELGEEPRILPGLPMKLRITDSRVAMIPLTATERATESVAVVHESVLLDALIALFEALWGAAHPVGAVGSPPDGELDEAHAQVVALLGSGLKDETIASNLGVSMRTAGRRIRHVLDLLHATTRFQAGAAAARRGWLPPESALPQSTESSPRTSGGGGVAVTEATSE